MKRHCEVLPVYKMKMNTPFIALCLVQLFLGVVHIAPSTLASTGALGLLSEAEALQPWLSSTRR